MGVVYVRAERALSQSSEPEMMYLATGLIVIWSAGILFLTGRALNFIRLVFNNLTPGKSNWSSTNFFSLSIVNFGFRIDVSAVDPASLTEVGRQYQKRAIRNERIMLVWALGGFVLFVWASRYF
jgi:hypothetical protein